MKYLNPLRGKRNILNVGYSDVRNKRKSKLWKWIKRIAFFIFLFLLFLQFNHFAMAIDALQHVNTDQANIINELGKQVHSLELHNANLQIQSDMMKVKINGLEIQNAIHNDSQHTDIHSSLHNAVHNIQPQTDTNVNMMDAIQTKIHNGLSSFTTMAAVTTTTIAAVSILLKGIHAFVPILP